jgi:hypothetical protein
MSAAGSHAAVAATSQQPSWHVSLPSENLMRLRGSADLWSVPIVLQKSQLDLR